MGCWGSILNSNFYYSIIGLLNTYHNLNCDWLKFNLDDRLGSLLWARIKVREKDSIVLHFDYITNRIYEWYVSRNWYSKLRNSIKILPRQVQFPEQRHLNFQTVRIETSADPILILHEYTETRIAIDFNYSQDFIGNLYFLSNFYRSVGNIIYLDHFPFPNSACAPYW